jgi:hypothetical protein
MLHWLHGYTYGYDYAMNAFLKNACGGCGRFVRGEPFVEGRDCRVCWLYANDPQARALWDAWPEADQPAALPEVLHLTVIRPDGRAQTYPLAQDVRRRRWSGKVEGRLVEFETTPTLTLWIGDQDHAPDPSSPSYTTPLSVVFAVDGGRVVVTI